MFQLLAMFGPCVLLIVDTVFLWSLAFLLKSIIMKVWSTLPVVALICSICSAIALSFGILRFAQNNKINKKVPVTLILAPYAVACAGFTAYFVLEILSIITIHRPGRVSHLVWTLVVAYVLLAMLILWRALVVRSDLETPAIRCG